MAAFVAGIFRKRCGRFALGTLPRRQRRWVWMRRAFESFLGEEVTKLIGAAGSKALIGVIVLVVSSPPLPIRSRCPRRKVAMARRPHDRQPGSG